VIVPWKGETGGAVELVDEQGKVMPLAFDHGDIWGSPCSAFGQARLFAHRLPTAAERFTLLQLQKVHETVLGGRSQRFFPPSHACIGGAHRDGENAKRRRPPARGAVSIFEAISV